MEGKIYVTPPPPQLSVSNRQTIDTNNPSKRIYQVWKGSNRFFLGGRLIFGPDARSLVFTVFLIMTPVIVFNVFISQRLFKEFQHHLGLLIVVISVVFPTCIIILLILTSSRDPGILPRNPHPPEPEDDDDDASGVPMDWAGNNTSAPSLPSTKDVSVNGIVVKVKYCHTCILYHPPRCSHCSICNNCVERFDHHCPWVGQCIGKRNYRFFFMFISSTTLLCFYVLAFCWVHIRKIMEAYHYNLWKALLKSPISGILILYTFVAAWFVGGLTSFHLYLICTNQTTYENFRFRYDGKTNPYNIGCARNVGEIFFSKVPNSKNNFRAKVKENSLSTFTNSLSVGNVLSPELPKTSIDIEIGGKRQAVVEEELEEIHSRIESVAELERCGTEPRHTNRGHKDNWEITPDIHALTAEFGREHGLTDREKIYVSH